MSDLEEKRQKYLALAHAVQSGVAAEMNIDPGPTSPKHLRVGVNMAMVEHAALILLLMDKGIITEEEYYDALIDAMHHEIDGYKVRLAEYYGVDIDLA